MKKFQDMRTPLVEGVYDKNIFKAIFLAGGPGSGKSYVAKASTAGMGLKMVNSDDQFEYLLDKEGLTKKMNTPRGERETDKRDAVRDRGKVLTAKKRGDIGTGKGGFVEGRLGMIIDGTGHDFEKIARQSSKLRMLGYETYMVFVNTSLDVALKANAERDRVVPTSVVTKSHKAVQSNLGKFSSHFRGNLVIVDNNDREEEPIKIAFKQVGQLLRKPVKNQIAKNWIAMELQKKRR
jgi:cytidylate kinase